MHYKKLRLDIMTKKYQKEIYETIKECIKAVEDQPTAYDANNVVSGLEQLKLDGILQIFQ